MSILPSQSSSSRSTAGKVSLSETSPARYSLRVEVAQNPVYRQLTRSEKPLVTNTGMSNAGRLTDRAFSQEERPCTD
jgi:hypothetical protein